MRARRQGRQQRAGCDGGAGGEAVVRAACFTRAGCLPGLLLTVLHACPPGLLRVTSLGRTPTIQSPPSWDERAEAEEDLLKASELLEAGPRCEIWASEPRASSVPLAHVTLPSSVEQNCAGVTSL